MKPSGLVGLLGLTASAACTQDERACDRPNTICTIAGGGTTDADTGRATEVTLTAPLATALSPTGELWVLDDHRVRAIDASGEIRTVAGTEGYVGTRPPSDGTPVPALEASLNTVADLVFHEGYVYLAACYESEVQRLRLSDMMIENVVGVGNRGYAGDDGPALLATLAVPSSIALDPAGNLVIMDQGNEVIRMIDGDNITRTIAGSCVAGIDGGTPFTCAPGFGGDGGRALNARLSEDAVGPSGRLTYDVAGNLIFADTYNHRIRRVDPDGVITTIAGTGADGYGGDGGLAVDAQLGRPIDVATAPDGSVYVSDVANHCIRQIDPSGIISTVVGQCDPSSAGFAGDGGPPLEATLSGPYGIDLVGNKLYISDTDSRRVRVVNLP